MVVFFFGVVIVVGMFIVLITIAGSLKQVVQLPE